MAEQVQIGRIAFREEGPNWVAYYALRNTMEGALFVASVRTNAVRGNDERKAEFITFVRNVISDVIEEETGIRIGWDEPSPAPESEQSGSA